jgi:hypothetical protein
LFPTDALEVVSQFLFYAAFRFAADPMDQLQQDIA